MFIWQVRSSSLTIALERAKKGENKAFGPPGQVGFHARQANFLLPGCSMEVDVDKCTIQLNLMVKLDFNLFSF